VQTTPLWPLVVYFVAVVGLAGVILLLSYFLGQHHSDPATGETFESGIKSTGSARLRFDVKYYLVAMFFVIFDLESAFILAWAVAARENGWSGYIEILVFIAVLAVGLVYLWRLGALDWGTGRRRRMMREGPRART
jgi:NADH-quinone oxidoreductase subunit A